MIQFNYSESCVRVLHFSALIDNGVCKTIHTCTVNSIQEEDVKWDFFSDYTK